MEPETSGLAVAATGEIVTRAEAGGSPRVSRAMLVVAMLSILLVGALSVAYRVPRNVSDMWWWNAIPLVHASSLGVLLVVRRGRWIAAVAVALVAGGLGGFWPWVALLTFMFNDPRQQLTPQPIGSFGPASSASCC